jgi:acetyltransferase-like isoleucine patch superfamily enzyme
VFAPTELSPRARSLAAAIIHRAWRWVATVGCVSPDDALGRRFRAMGPGSCIAFPPGSVFGEQWIEIGAATMIGPSVSLAAGMPHQEPEPDRAALVVIGDRCSIGRGSSIVGLHDIRIENDVSIAPDVYITDHNHSYRDISTPVGQQWPTIGSVRIGAGSWLGTGVVVLAGADIGRNVTVAAGSIVRGTVPDFSVVAGVPARIIRRHVDGEGWVRLRSDGDVPAIPADEEATQP